MKAEHFIATLKQVVHDSAVQDVCSTLDHPSGRRPVPRLVELSRWYHALSPADRLRLTEVIRLAAHSSIFGLLCVLDGSRAIEDSPDKGQLELSFTSGSERHLLNNPQQEFLHDIYQSLVYSEVFGESR